MAVTVDSIKGKIGTRADGTVGTICAASGCWRHSLDLLRFPALEWETTLITFRWDRDDNGAWLCPKHAREVQRVLQTD